MTDIVDRAAVVLLGLVAGSVAEAQEQGCFDAGPKVWSVWSGWFRREGSTVAHYGIVNGAGASPVCVLSFAECLLGRLGSWHPGSQKLFDAYVERQGH
jgi:hypothetical protein